MKLGISFLLTVVVVSALSIKTHADAVPSSANAPSCSSGDPVVATERVAREIYVSIARGLYPHSWRKYRQIVVLDEGDNWSVGQTNSPHFRTGKSSNADEVSVSMGGGALEMEISKCNAAVSISFSR